MKEKKGIGRVWDNNGLLLLLLFLLHFLIRRIYDMQLALRRLLDRMDPARVRRVTVVEGNKMRHLYF